MSKATCTKFKFFFADQDVEQEQWLRAMALKGLHLKKLNLLQMWTFVKGEPADMVYRVDFNSEWQKAGLPAVTGRRGLGAGGAPDRLAVLAHQGGQWPLA